MDTLPTLDRDCSALAGLFQIIVNEMKGSGPMWEDFLSKACKLHHALKATLVALSGFLDAFQRIADAATSTRGATKEVGAALTRVCLRHRAIEARAKALTNALVESVVSPLQEKLDEWRRTHIALDKEHTKEYKRARSDIKKRTDSALRLQKKAKKAGKTSELNKVLDSTLSDLTSRYHALEDTEKSALRHALTEERARYCTFAVALKPVLEEEVGLVTEIGHLQEVMNQLEKYSVDPHILPPASEQVLHDIKSGDAQWSWQTPPSSPSSSLGSRKSSMCSISSLNSSSSSSTHSPSHHARTRSVSQGTSRLVSVSSQDSGFTSQDALHHGLAFMQASGLSEQSCGSETGHAPSPAAGTATWPNLTDPSLNKNSAVTAAPPLSDRPHTISTAYEKGKDRPSLTVYTFQPPEGLSSPASPQISSQPVSPVCLESDRGNISPLVSHTATISRRSSRASLHHNLSSSSQESLANSNKPKPPVPNRCSSLERPSIPEKKPNMRQHQHQLMQHHHQLQQLQQQLQYQQQQIQQHQSTLQQQQSRPITPCSIPSITPSIPSVPDFNQAAPDMIVPQPVYSNMAELRGEVEELDRRSIHTSSGFGSQTSIQFEEQNVDESIAGKYCTLRRFSETPLGTFSNPQYRPGVVVLRRQISDKGLPSRTNSLRRSGSHSQTKPPPPIRRTPMSTSTTSLSSLHMNHSCSSASLVTTTTTAGVNGSSSTGSSTTSSPLQRTDSESSTPVGSLENLPPPPAFLLEEGEDEIVGGPELTTPEGVRFFSDTPPPSSPITVRTLSVSEAVKSLQDTHHQPPSPLTHRRTHSLRSPGGPQSRMQYLSEERRSSLEDANRTSLVSSLNAKFSNTQQLPPTGQKIDKVLVADKHPGLAQRSRPPSCQETSIQRSRPPSCQESSQKPSQAPKQLHHLQQQIEQQLQQQLRIHQKINTSEEQQQQQLRMHQNISLSEEQQLQQQQQLRIHKKMNTSEENLSPRLRRSRLGSVQEGVIARSPTRGSLANGQTFESIGQTTAIRVSQEDIYQQTKIKQQNSVQNTSSFNPKVTNPSISNSNNHHPSLQRSESQPAFHSVPTTNKVANQNHFLETLNIALAQRQQSCPGEIPSNPSSPRIKAKKLNGSKKPIILPKSQPNGTPPNVLLQRSGSGASDKASKVRQWIAGKSNNTNDLPIVKDNGKIPESLLDQIRRGTNLKRTKQVADRSAPQVY